MVIITPNQGQKHDTLRPLPDAVPEALVEQPCVKLGERWMNHLGGGFKYIFMFTPTWRRFQFRLIFFKRVETTN